MRELGRIFQERFHFGSAETLRTNRYERHIKKGLSLIRKGQYERALIHFEKRQAIADARFSFEEPRVLMYHGIPTREEMQANSSEDLTEIEFSSSFSRPQAPGGLASLKLMGVAFFSENLADLRQPVLPAYIQEPFLHHVALVHAEEWIHGLFYLQHKNYDPSVEEGEVARYLQKHHVTLTDRFLNHYGRREYLREKNH